MKTDVVTEPESTAADQPQEGLLPRSVSYRHDLDGLRGIAIAFVVIFHIFVGKVSGGVDVFLLLSGYFFLGSQLRYAQREDASANPWWPLWRTARRIVPALVLVLATTAAVGLWLLPQLRRFEIIDQFTASLLYFQNIELARQQADYNVASDTVSPLQHLWSISVQGQFYVAAIALAMCVIWLRRAGLNIMPLIGPLLLGVTAASFSYAWWLHLVDQPHNYYSTFARTWQLSLGALLAFYGHKLRLPALFALVGLGMVLTTALLFDGALYFPGPASLYPLAGAALVILSGGYGRTARVLAHRSMRWLGDIAYPLYLWHWPTLIISTAYLGFDSPPLWLGFSVLLGSVFVAWLTHVAVEKPLRQHSKRPLRGENRIAQTLSLLKKGGSALIRLWAGIGVAVLVAALISVQAIWQMRLYAVDGEVLDRTEYPGALALFGAEVPDVPAKPDPELLGPMLSMIWEDGCISRFGDDHTVLPVDVVGEGCLYGDVDSQVEVYLVGGSHSDHWITALHQLGVQHGFKIVPLLRQSCPAFVQERDNGLFSRECQEFNERVIERLDEVRPDLVIATTTRPLIEQGGRREAVPRSYRTLWEFLDERNIAFAGLRDNPWRTFDNGAELSVPLCMLALDDDQACGQPFEDFYLPVDPAARYLAGMPHAKAIDTSGWFCVDGHCPAVIGNIYVYRDGNHLSNAYSHSLAPLLWEEIKEFF